MIHTGFSYRRLGAGVASLAALVVLLVSSHLRSTQQNNYVRVADAWLHGRMWIDWPGRWMDAVYYNGHHYGVDGPVPALFMLPAVLIWGTAANQTLVAILFATVSVGLAWTLCERLGVTSTGTKIWLVVFFFAGTDVWWCAQLGDVWFLAHLVAVAFVLGALVELYGKRRGWLIALCMALAAGARFPEVAALPIFLPVILSPSKDGAAPPVTLRLSKGARSFTLVLIAAAVAFIGYDELMWGTILDIGHTVYFHADPWGQPTGSPFSLAYLPYQLYSFFFRAPVLVEWLQRAQWPYLKPDTNGLALTFTSPALLLALRARTPRPTVIALWLATALVAAPAFLYYLNGWVQFGMRHMLDFFPYLFALMALGVRERLPLWGKILIVWSALAGTWGVWYWNAFVRTAN